jgi:two-component system response regulator AtoC
MSLNVLVIDDEEGFCAMLQSLLTQEGFIVTTETSATQGLARVHEEQFDVVLCDVQMPGMDGLGFLEAIREHALELTVIMMSAYGTVEVALKAMKAGAYDYISKPFNRDEIVLTLRKAAERLELRAENARFIRKIHDLEGPFEEMVGESEPMRRLFATIDKVAPYKSTVLLMGESGTGKELAARAIHRRSGRTSEAFVAVNCGAIPSQLLESELFGHRKGAFTDARKDKAGLFEEASGGTLFLDEIGELPLEMQVKLLRVLQEGEVRPIGASKPRSIDVRIIAATVKDLEEEVRGGRFREDLFYRLHVVPIHMTPLRERIEDIPLLTAYFLERLNLRLETQIREVGPAAMRRLMGHSWPGNVRELGNTLERAIVLSEGDVISIDSLPDAMLDRKDPITATLRSGELSVKKTQRIIESELIRRALKQTGGNRTQASKLLELSHRALLYKIKDYGLTDL